MLKPNFVIPKNCHYCSTILIQHHSLIAFSCNKKRYNEYHHFYYRNDNNKFTLNVINFDNSKYFSFEKDTVQIYGDNFYYQMLNISITCFDDAINFIKNFSIID